MHSVFDTTMALSAAHKNKNKSPFQTRVHDEDKTNSKWEWYDPPEKSPVTEFFMDTSIHGLHYLGQRQRHLCERVFWLSSFIAAVITATLLIRDMLNAYLSMPIVTVFNPIEKTLNEIPFPAVTVCNVNNIRKSKMEELRRKAEEGLSTAIPDEEFLQTLATLLDIHHICDAGKTFARRFVEMGEDYGEVGEEMQRRHKEFIHLSNPLATIRNYSQSCAEMILLCVWLDEVQNCSKLFQEIETDYGYCCTFNTIPVSLLMKNVTDPRDESQFVQDWMDAEINYDNLLFTKDTSDRKYPYRQRYPGRTAGLSILLNPDLEEYYCTNTDSKGFVVALNVPIDFPRMKDKGVAVRTNSEVFISVRPEITISDETIKRFKLEDRDCYFSNEKSLPHYTKYTSSNCVIECITKRTMGNCKCLRYYMPSSGDENEKLCRPKDYKCTDEVRENVTRRGIGTVCEKCLPTCTEIAYYTETTSLEMSQDHLKKLLENTDGPHKVHNASILHVYFNVDSTYPRLRKEMTTVNNLISSAGGLLGLCMGFSMLSLLEIIYHATIRLFCKSHRDQSKAQKTDRHNRNCLETSATNFTNDKTSIENNGFLSNVFQFDILDSRLLHTGTTSDVPGELSLAVADENLPSYFQAHAGTGFPRSKKAWTQPDNDGKCTRI